MLTAILTANTLESIPTQLATAKDCDIIEWRLDYLKNLDLTTIADIRKTLIKPVIFTLRPTAAGGCFEGSETERLQLLQTLGDLNPTYLDLEEFVDNAFIAEFTARYPAIQIIRSYHNFANTPADLSQVLQSLMHPAVSIYKIVTKAESSLDALRMLHFVKKACKTHTLVGHCLGEFGQFSRICGAILGNAWTYASLEAAENTLGILSLNDLVHIYRIQSLNHETAIYALLGDPVASSIGHQFHNQIFATEQRNAVYVKIRLRADELPAFFALIQELPFAGFSVTIPLKEAILPYVQPSLSACNTLRLRGQIWEACNTDGVGAVQALKPFIDLKGKSVLLLGAGGAALGIAAALLDEVSSIAVVNRTLERAKAFAAQLGVPVTAFEHIEAVPTPDIIIQTLPGVVELPAAWRQYLTAEITSNTVIMDIDYRSPNASLQTLIKKSGCREVPGRDMFNYQALAQQAFWLHRFHSSLHSE